MNRKLTRSILRLALVVWSLTCLTCQTWAGGLIAIASFNGDNGANPRFSGATLDAQGNLYGTAYNGGANGMGTVWEIAKGTDTITTIASFNGGNGQQPAAGVTLDAQGNLYGTTVSGASNDGTVWEIAKGSSTITTIATFNGTNGSGPFGGVTLDAQGNLYGTTHLGAGGGGTVWEIAKGSNAITTIAAFNGGNGNPRVPTSGVTLDAQGNLYGTTQQGGTNSMGTVWEIAKGTGVITILASFNGGNGDAPHAGVTLDAQGNLYGTTTGGGASNDGTVWEIAKGSNTITTIASFNGTNGSLPLVASHLTLLAIFTARRLRAVPTAKARFGSSPWGARHSRPLPPSTRPTVPIPNPTYRWTVMATSSEPQKAEEITVWARCSCSLDRPFLSLPVSYSWAWVFSCRSATTGHEGADDWQWPGCLCVVKMWHRPAPGDDRRHRLERRGPVYRSG